MKDKTAEEILELHFGSEYYRLKELGYLENIVNAMQEYGHGNASQFREPSIADIEKAFIAGRSKQSWESFKNEVLGSIADKWIPVRERLPEKDAIVIARLEHWDSKNPRFSILKHVKEDDQSWRTADDNSEVSYSFNVTHWQPLPPPPGSSQPKDVN